MSDSSSAHRVAKTNELRDGVPKRVKAGDTPILLIRKGEEIRAFQADCPHAGAPLDEGAVCRGRLVCPWHKGTFDTDSGALLEPPALHGLMRYAVTLDGDDVLVCGEAGEPQPAAQVREGKRRKADTFAIVGGGAAGAAACASLREFGFAGRLVLIDAETSEPYDRTALSKFVPSGELNPSEVYPLLPPDFFHQHHVERTRGRVTRLNASTREIAIDGSLTLNYDAALFAPGSVPKAPRIRGLDNPAVRKRVVLLSGLDDALKLDRLAAAGGHAAVIGSSFIGLEVASALRKRKLRVTVVSPAKTPFATQFGDEIGAHFRTLHEQNGTAFRMDAHVAAIQPDHPLRLEFDDGTGLDCDFVIVGTGAQPATACLEGVARNDDGGVDVDESMRVAEALYAAGDIAAFLPAPGSRCIRIEHWRVAQQQARAAARAMLGLDAAPPLVPFFWTYHYGKRFDYLGHVRAGDWDKLVTIGSLERDDFVTLFARDNTVLAVLACNREHVSACLAEMLRDPLTVDAARRLIGSAQRDS
ncbi:FAD-dependent oxidoreductase [Paraburkholderia sp. D1E]|uniref:FAD-dependent oxidoreductase n=1 Tax=Paraburkholderia sp. D1E TaxID=3461398 RepID=UPI0040453405